MSAPKPIRWLGDSHDAVREFPREVRVVVGQALFEAQLGGRHAAAKPLSGFGGAGRGRGVRAARVPEEEQTGDRDPKT